MGKSSHGLHYTRQFGQSTPKNKNSRIHVVQKGESLWDISKKYKVSIDDLVKWNELEGTRIRAGQNIYVEPQF